VDLTEQQHSVQILQYVKLQRAKLVAELKKLDELEADHEALIQGVMGKDNEVGTLMVNGKEKPVITWKWGKQNRLDQKMLKANFPEIEKVCRRDFKIRTFSVEVD
jgi:predicted phage-related endonuclease